MLLSACQTKTPVPTPDLFSNNQPTAPQNTVGDIKFEIEWGECPFQSYEVKAECGTLTVPADYAHPDNGETLTLPFGRYKTQGTNPKSDPVLLVAGFPLLAQAGFLPFLFEDIFKERDLLIFDVRGMGLAEPALVCPGLQTAWWGSLPMGGLTSEQWGEAHTQCRESLEAQKVNLDLYNLPAIAADFRTLRLALGYTSWNIVAVGQGAYIAYEQLRSDPDGVRSLIIDTTIPVYSTKPLEYTAANATLHNVFDACVQDADCNETFPDIEQVFYEVVTELDEKPITVTANDDNTGRRTEFFVNGQVLLDLTLQIARSSDLERIAQIPRMIYQLRSGTTTVLVKMSGLYIAGNDYSLQGIYSLVGCRQNPLPNASDVESALIGLPASTVTYFNKAAKDQQAICAAWGPLPTESPVQASGSAPILLLNGEWDWANSPALLEEFKRLVPSAQVVSFPRSGANVFFTRGTMQCSQTLFRAFMDDPAAPLDKTCSQAERKITWITLP
jgi:pimeloyl-ACP methyl ester carboxylesterase